MAINETLLTSLALDFEGYSEAIKGADGETRLTARDEAPWLQDLLSIDGTVVQVMQAGGANTYVAETDDQYFTGVFGLPGPSQASVDGTEFAPGRMALLRPGEVVAASSIGVYRWCSISIPCDKFIQSVDRFDASATKRLMSGPVSLQISPTDSRSVVGLIERIIGVAKAGHGLESPAGGRAASAELVSAFVGAVASSPAGRASGDRRRQSHARIIGLVHEFLEATGDCYSVADLAANASISERTLRIVFAENFGVSPKRLLILRQLHAVRRDLRRASSGETVSQIAMRHDAWELGRLAHRYRYLFGESPSETLMGVRQSHSRTQGAA